MAEERELSLGQQTTIRALSAERTRAILAHDQAIDEFRDMLMELMGLEGDWAFAGTMDAIRLVAAPKTPPGEPSE